MGFLTKDFEVRRRGVLRAVPEQQSYGTKDGLPAGPETSPARLPRRRRPLPMPPSAAWPPPPGEGA